MEVLMGSKLLLMLLLDPTYEAAKTALRQAGR